jgi:hypothetical protein
LVHDGIHLSSIRQINALPSSAKRALYRSLVPVSILSQRCVTSLVGTPQEQPFSIQIRCPESTCFAEIDVRYVHQPRDPVLYVHLADTASGQLQVLLMQISDPHAPRFDIDRDWSGESTKLGALKRNIPAELEAMEAGLAPGQVRFGLRLSRKLVPAMEELAAGLGKDRFLIEPLAYHSAVIFERYGFAYIVGQAKMESIDRGFRPGGTLARRLDSSTPFRRPRAGETVRGRSWAIHDGILGEPWSEVRMYKRVGHCAGMCTCPGVPY